MRRTPAIRAQQRQTNAIHATRVQAASEAKAQAEAVEAAVTGDLIEASPTLAAKLADLEGRVQVLEE